MHLDQLKYYISVCDNRSLTLASQELFITQQSLSISISKLEKELGATLLQRTNRGVHPTEMGKKVYAFALKTIQAWEQLQNEANGCALVKNLVHDTIKFKASAFFEYIFLPHILFKASQFYPNIKFTGEIANFESIINELKQKNIDFGLTNIAHNTLTDEYLQINSDVLFAPLFPTKMYVWINKESPLFKKSVLQFNDIKKHHIILSAYSDTHFFQNIFQEDFTNLNITYFKSAAVLATHIEQNPENISLDVSVGEFGLSLNTFLQNRNVIAIPFKADSPYECFSTGYLFKKDNPKNNLIHKIFYDISNVK